MHGQWNAVVKINAGADEKHCHQIVALYIMVIIIVSLTSLDILCIQYSNCFGASVAAGCFEWLKFSLY